MFIPFKDSNPLVIIPFQYATLALIVLNVLVFALLQSGFAPPGLKISTGDYGLIPAAFTGLAGFFPRLTALPDELTLISYMFLHGSWMHLLGNMAFLWVFGDNVEDAMGHARFLLFYLLCGAAAGLAHAWMSPASPAPLIGASGAVAGVIAAYLLLYPHVRVWILVLWRLPLRLPAMVVLGFWILVQMISVANGSGSRTAWWAHLGGFAAGMVLVPLFKRRSIRLLSRPKRD